MKEQVITWFFGKDTEQHNIGECVSLLAGAGVVVVGLFAFCTLVGLFA